MEKGFETPFTSPFFVEKNDCAKLPGLTLVKLFFGRRSRVEGLKV